jgi:hypothetical protein
LKYYFLSINLIPHNYSKQAAWNCSQRNMNLLSLFGKWKNYQSKWKESVIVPLFKMGDKIDYSNFHFCQLFTKY